MESVRFTITAPELDPYGAPMPDGGTAYSVYARHAILDAFPAATFGPATGAWRGQTEPVTVYEIDVNAPVAAQAAETLARIAAGIARYAEQESVYVTSMGAHGFRRATVAPGWEASAAALLYPFTVSERTLRHAA